MTSQQPPFTAAAAAAAALPGGPSDSQQSSSAKPGRRQVVQKRPPRLSTVERPGHPTLSNRKNANPQVELSSAPVEAALMSPVTPGENLQHIQEDHAASASLPQAASGSPLTTHATNINSNNAYQSTSLPSPDPSHDSRTSPASAVGRNLPANSPSGAHSPSPCPHILIPMHVQLPSRNPSPVTPTVTTPNSILMPAASGGGGGSRGPTPASRQLGAGPGLSRMRQPNPPPTPRSPMAPVQLNGQTASVTDALLSKLSFDDQSWASLLRQIDAIMDANQNHAYFLSSAVELPRLRLLRDACRTKDLFYLVLHQVYCLQTVFPREFFEGLKFSVTQILGLDVIKQLLVDNERVSADFLKWSVHFPVDMSIGMKSELYETTVYQIRQSLRLIAEGWTSFETCVRDRLYPPLLDELIAKFNVTSSVLSSIIFTALSRRIYGNQFDKQLHAIFMRNQENYHRRFTGNPVSADQMQRENQALIEEYRLLHAQNLREAPRSFPQVSQSQQPRHRQPASPAVQHQNFPMSLPLSTTMGQAGQQVSCPNAAGNANINRRMHVPVMTQARSPSFPTRNVPGGAFATSTASPVVPLQSTLMSQGPGQAPTAVDSRLRLMMSLPHLRHLRHPVSGAAQTTPPGAASPGPALVHVSAPLGVSSRVSQPSGPNLMATAPPYAQAHVRSPGMAARASPQVHPQSHVVPGPCNSQVNPQQAHFSIYTPLLPPPNAVPTHLSRPHPIRVALHQAHLRNPHRKCVRQGAFGEEETELFQYLSSFAVKPSPLGQEECAFHWTFSLSCQDIERFPRSIPNGEGQRATRIFRDGCLTYRFRCIKMPPKKDVSEEFWTLAEAVWPSVIYVHVNSVEMYVRRKIHNGKDIPLDITDNLREGENKVSLYFLRSPAESKDLMYAAAVEVMSVAGFEKVKAMARTLPAAESLRQIQRRLQPRNEDDDDDVAIISEDMTINIADPFMARVFNIPARSRLCTHFECFDLDTFIATKASQSGKSHMKEHWRCPICGGDARPHMLIIDGFLAEVHAELERTNRLEGAKAILVNTNGSWELKTDEETQSTRGREEQTAVSPSKIPAKRKSVVVGFPTNEKNKKLKVEERESPHCLISQVPSHQANSPDVIELD